MDIWRFNKLIVLDYFQQDVQVVIFFPTVLVGIPVTQKDMMKSLKSGFHAPL